MAGGEVGRRCWLRAVGRCTLACLLHHAADAARNPLRTWHPAQNESWGLPGLENVDAADADDALEHIALDTDRDNILELDLRASGIEEAAFDEEPSGGQPIAEREGPVRRPQQLHRPDQGHKNIR